MNSKSKNWLLILFAVVLVIISTPIFGLFYKLYFGPVTGGFFWGPSHQENIPGFFMSYVFVVTVISTVFISRNKYKIIFALLIIPFLLIITFRLGNDLVIDSILVFFGWLIGEGVLRLYQVYQASKNKKK
ncbi:MAG: hypothetical protein WC668_02435 [Patescibacteria group bacterium]|jgi:hypothetical protein